MPAVVEQVVQARLIISAGRSARLQVTLRYRADDPLAVRMVFPVEYALDGTDEEPGPADAAAAGVEWVFARRLLAGGLEEPSGLGDVHVRPVPERGTVVELRAPEGVAVLRFTTADLRRFLWRSHLAVPEDQESRYLDPDRELAELLGHLG
nr:SsgA family sporulation/cell division regulator [Kitasatospora sp. MBT63]